MSRWLPTLGLFGVSLLLSVGAAEVALRWWLGPPVHFRYPQPRYVPHPEVGHWLEPGQRSFNHDAPLRINSLGIRGPERSGPVPPGAVRILALGDSQTFGNGLALEETWPAQLEQELDRRTRPAGSPDWEVLNAGLSGTDAWQHERMLEVLAEIYAFDAVVLGFYVNDVTQIYEPGAVRERTNTWSKRVAYQAKRSAVLTALWQILQRLLVQGDGAERELRILTGEPHPDLEAAWDQVERSLVEMKRAARRREAPLFLLVLPRRDQVSAPDPPTAYNERIAGIARRHGIPLLDALEPLRKAHRELEGSLFIPWDGHNSALANRVIAEALAGALLRHPEWLETDATPWGDPAPGSLASPGT